MTLDSTVISPGAFRALREASLTERQAEAIYARGKEAVVFALLELTKQLWCFTTRDLTYFMIDRSRGSPALLKFFIEEFAGTLVTDFWGAYNGVARALRQTCLAIYLTTGQLPPLPEPKNTPDGRIAMDI